MLLRAALVVSKFTQYGLGGVSNYTSIFGGFKENYYWKTYMKR